MTLKIIFITGTDTGVGKTVLTCLLLSHLRQQGGHALAMKPFCSGSEAGLTDVDILYELQDQDLATHEINPFFFPEPLAPLVAARRHCMRVTLDNVLSRIRSVITEHLLPIENATRGPRAKRRRESKIQNATLLIEGAGGLLAPLGEGFNLLEVIAAMPQAIKQQAARIKDQASRIEHPTAGIQTVVVAPNQLGTINHTLLTAQALQNRFQRRSSSHVSGFTFHETCPATVVLMASQRSDLSSRSNPAILSELLPAVPVFSLPYFPALAASLSEATGKSAIKRAAKRLGKRLEQILASPVSP